MPAFAVSAAEKEQAGVSEVGCQSIGYCRAVCARGRSNLIVQDIPLDKQHAPRFFFKRMQHQNRFIQNKKLIRAENHGKSQQIQLCCSLN